MLRNWWITGWGSNASKQYLTENPAPQTIDELLAHRLVGYVEDLLASPSLAYATEFSRDFHPRFARVFRARPGRSRVLRCGYRHPARLHRPDAAELVPIMTAIDIRRTYFTVWHESMRSLRRIQAVVQFIQSIVERDRKVFL